MEAVKEFRHFVNGELVPSARRKMFDKRRPSDGKRIGAIHEGGEAEIDAAVGAARRALRGPWGRMTTDERSALLDRVATEIEGRAEDFVDAEMNDTGQPKSLVS